MPDQPLLSTALEPRYPRLLHITRWIQRHYLVVLVAAAFAFGCVALGDLLTPAEWIAGGFYLIPLTLVAVTLRRTATVVFCVVAVVLVMTVMAIQHVWSSPQHLLFLYFLIVACGGVVVLADLLSQIDEVSRRAVHRARLAQAEADIVSQSSRPGGLHSLIDSAVRRIAEELGADLGLAFVLDGGDWHGEAGVGLPGDPHLLRYPYDTLIILRRAVEDNEALVIPDAPSWFAERGLEAPAYVGEYGLKRVLAVPMRAFDLSLGAMVFSKSPDGAFSKEQVRFAESIGGHVAVAIENARLMAQLDAKRRDLSLVVESSLDFAASLEPRRVIEAVVERLVAALDVSACDIHVLEPDLNAVRTMVSYDHGRFDFGEVVGRLWSLSEYSATDRVVTSGEPVVVTSRDDPQLNERERQLLSKNGKTSQVGLPLKARDRVIGVVEMFDDSPGREYTPEQIELAEAICQFAALALDNAQLYDSQRETSSRLEHIAAQLQTLQQVSLRLGRLREEAAVLREVVESGAELLDADSTAYAVRDGEVAVVKAFHDRDGFSAPHAAAADGVVSVLRDALPQLAAATGGEDAGQQAQVDVALSHRGALVVPLKRHRPDAVAALIFQRRRRGAFSDDDKRLATTLAAQLALTLRNVHAFQREHEIAETFQTALLVEPPMLAGAEIGVKYQAAAQAVRIGGDFYDILTLGPGRVMIAVGDVCGRGLQAAVETALVRYTLRAYAQEGSPGEALSRLNSALLAQDPDLPFVTVVLAYLDVTRRNLEYAVAGHPRPLVLAGRRQFSIAQQGGFPVSMFPGEIYTTNRCVLPENATIVFYTDGLTEARRQGRMLGERGLRETVRRHLTEPAQQLADSLTSRAARYAGGTLEDDVAAVVVRLP